MDTREVEKSYNHLLKDADFKELESLLNSPNIFQILKVEHREIRHSNFLAWLLDPKGSHGLSSVFLKAFINDVTSDHRYTSFASDDLKLLDEQEVYVLREHEGIDILIYTNDLVFVIENKIWSNEQNDQLKKYRGIVETNFPNHKKGYVFLTPYGKLSSQDKYYVNYSYSQINGLLEAIIHNQSLVISTTTRTYLQNYTTTLRQHIMGNDKTNELAKRLYKKHKDVLDFILENIPDPYVEFANKLSAMVEGRDWTISSRQKYFVRFYTNKLKPVLVNYKEHNGWPDRDAFLFQITIYTNKITFEACIANPTEKKEYYEGLSKILDELKSPDLIEGTWKHYFQIVKHWTIEEIMLDWDNGKSELIEGFLNEVTPIVQKVEAKMLEHKNELQKLKEGIEQYD